MRAGFLRRVRAAFLGVTFVPMPAGSGLAALADVADRECRDAFPQLVVRREHPVVAMAVLPRRRDEIGEPVQELKRWSRNSNGVSSMTPVDPGCVIFSVRPGPTQFPRLCRGRV